MKFQDAYSSKLTTAENIAGRVQNGWRLCADTALANPIAIYTALGKRINELEGVIVDTMIDLFPLAWFQSPDTLGKITGISWFHGAGARKAMAGGFADLMPARYFDGFDVVRNYSTVDAYCVVVSPMDKHGYFSTGVTASLGPPRLEIAKHVYLEVNKFMPRSTAGPQIHISQVDAFCENHRPLISLPEEPIDPASQKIGEFIAERIPDGACLQLGIGTVPNVVGGLLKSKRHLGLHTEMLTDSMVDLLECGAADNSRKNVRRGRSVATFAMGSQKLYDLIDDNPMVEMLPADFVNSPGVIAQNDHVVSVNAALEVDLFGQVCAESIGPLFMTGSGGQPDFVRGAVMSKGGQSFIAFPSTANTKDGVISKIRPAITPGGIITTSKNETDMVVTEYGVAKIRGQVLSKRIKNLIAIAHPDFRDMLAFEAKKRNYLF
jgi:acyl-CoA hydrolase